MTNLRSILNQLHHQRADLQKQVHSLDAALAVLDSLDHGGRIGHPARKISTAGRARIAAAQKKRWAKVKGEKVVPITRKMSAAARKRIVAAQKARWVKWRREHR
jgi:hypothetical protein